MKFLNKTATPVVGISFDQGWLYAAQRGDLHTPARYIQLPLATHVTHQQARASALSQLAQAWPQDAHQLCMSIPHQLIYRQQFRYPSHLGKVDGGHTILAHMLAAAEPQLPWPVDDIECDFITLATRAKQTDYEFSAIARDDLTQILSLVAGTRWVISIVEPDQHAYQRALHHMLAHRVSGAAAVAAVGLSATPPAYLLALGLSLRANQAGKT